MVNMKVLGCRGMSSICRSVVLCVFLSGSITAWAYEETTVSNGGTVSGTVQFSGEIPPPMPFELRRYPDPVYCGALSDGSGFRLLRSVAVGSQQGLKDVIVTIEGIEKGKPFEFTETKLEANGTSPTDSEKSGPGIARFADL
jgi:hypothetical protein